MFCGQCGAKSNSGSSYCTNCGNKLYTVEPFDDIDDEKPPQIATSANDPLVMGQPSQSAIQIARLNEEVKRILDEVKKLPKRTLTVTGCVVAAIVLVIAIATTIGGSQPERLPNGTYGSSQPERLPNGTYTLSMQSYGDWEDRWYDRTYGGGRRHLFLDGTREFSVRDFIDSNNVLISAIWARFENVPSTYVYYDETTGGYRTIYSQSPAINNSYYDVYKYEVIENEIMLSFLGSGQFRDQITQVGADAIGEEFFYSFEKKTDQSYSFDGLQFNFTGS